MNLTELTHIADPMAADIVEHVAETANGNERRDSVATVMSWHNSEGLRGTCNARCHNARLPECDCMCGGQYHGKGLLLGGLERAVREHGGEILKSAQQRAANEGLELKATSIGELLTVLSKKPGILDLDGDKGVL